MSFYAWIKRNEYALSLALVATVAGISVAGLAYGWTGLAAGLAVGLILWLTPWHRLVAAFVRWLGAWLFVPDAAPKRVQLAHERLPRRVRRRVPDHLLPYDRLKIRYGEHVAALLVFASGMGLIVLAAAVWALGTAWGLNNPGSKAAATLFFGGIGVFALWRPDVEWVAEESSNNECCESFMDDLYYHPAFCAWSGNIYHRDDDGYL
jgi:hypothetical protein